MVQPQDEEVFRDETEDEFARFFSNEEVCLGVLRSVLCFFRADCDNLPQMWPYSRVTICSIPVMYELDSINPRGTGPRHDQNMVFLTISPGPVMNDEYVYRILT